MNTKKYFLVFLSVMLIGIFPSHRILGQSTSNIQVKVYDEALNPQTGIDLKISRKDIITTNARGIAFIEMDESELPPSEIAVNHSTFEVESWNYSKGVLEVILRKKSYREVIVKLIESNTNQPVQNLAVKIKTSDTVISCTSTRIGELAFLLPISQNLNSSVSFIFDNYTIIKSQFETNSGILYIKETVEKRIESIPTVPSDINTPSEKDVMQEISIETLDSITSITVFYSLMKSLNLSAIDSITRKRLDRKFDELLTQEGNQYDLPRNPLALINDSTILSDDIKLIVEKIKQEEALLVDAREEFETASGQIQMKLKDGGQKLNQEERDQLVQDILSLREMLRRNEELFYKNNAYFNLQVNTLINQLVDIYELEDQLIETEKESTEMREKFLIFFMAFLVVSIITVLLTYLIRIFRTQKSELAKANEEISIMNANLEGLITEKTKNLKLINSELDTFFYRSSHNMRGPITTIKGLSNIATITLDEEGKMLFEKVDHTTRGMERMLDKLNMIHQLNRPEAFDKISINEIVDETIRTFEPTIARRNIHFEYEVNGTIAFNSYRIIISIILNNLIENALYFCQFTSEKVSKVMLKVSLDAEDNLSIVVRDNGCGIKENVIDRIWDMFFIGIEKSKGSGLGLYIARKAVMTIRGEISVSTKIDEYSEFTVVLPLFLPDQNATIIEEHPQKFSVIETEKDKLIS